MEIRAACLKAAAVREVLAPSLGPVARLLGWPHGFAYLVDGDSLQPAGTYPAQESIDGGTRERARELAARAGLGDMSVHEPGDDAGGGARVAVPVRAGGQPVAVLAWLAAGPQPKLPVPLDWLLVVADLLSGVAERERAERNLQQAQESEEKFRVLSEAAFEGVALHEHGRILLANEALARLLGYDRAEDLIGKSAIELAAPASRERVARNIASRSKEPYEVEGLRRDGTCIPGELRGGNLMYRGREVRVTALRETIALKRAERERERLLAELHAALAEAHHAVQLREEFLSVASHELRTPLTSLQLAVQAMERVPGLPDPGPALLDVISRQVARLGRLVDDLLDVSRMKAGQLQLKLEPMDLVGLVQEVSSRFAPELERARCELRLRTPPSAPGVWDRSRLDQVIANLLSNAAKYGAGAPVELEVEAGDDEVRLTVCDHGIGIAPDALARLFEPFERGVSSEHYGGLGLGLYIVRQVVEQHAGQISVDSEPGQGACFRVTLPVRPRAAAPSS